MTKRIITYLLAGIALAGCGSHQEKFNLPYDYSPAVPTTIITVPPSTEVKIA